MPSSRNDFSELCAPGVRALQPYLPGKPVAELEREYGISNAIKLASNENPFGPSPRALQAAAAVLPDIARYPEGSGYQLVNALAALHGVDPRCITLGNGSNDVLDLLARVFLTPEHECVYSKYAFAVYPIVVQAAGARAVVAPAHDGTHGPAFGHDLDAMRKRIGRDTRLVFIANPNNPTGTWLASNALQAFIDDLPDHVVVVVDEAYFEYVGEADYPDTSGWLSRYPNLVVTRTFSKAYGLAGLRVGYAISHPGIADLLNRVRQPFNVNMAAQAAAVAALEDRQHLADCVARNAAGRVQLEAGFEKLGLACIPSVGNFVCVDTGRQAAGLFEALLHEGIIVRPVANYGMPNHLRVTVGSKQENAACLAALDKVLG